MPKQKLGPLQRKWLRALESGKFRQARGQLAKKTHGHIGYCCLGVACVVNGLSLYRPTKDHFNFRTMFDGADGGVPDHIQKRMELYSSTGASRQPHLCRSLDSLNDTAKARFKTIAKTVRAHPEAYFTGPA